MSCGVGYRHCLDPVLLWLWCRPAAVALIGPLPWELPYGCCPEKKKILPLHLGHQAEWIIILYYTYFHLIMVEVFSLLSILNASFHNYLPLIYKKTFQKCNILNLLTWQSFLMNNTHLEVCIDMKLLKIKNGVALSAQQLKRKKINSALEFYFSTHSSRRGVSYS